MKIKIKKIGSAVLLMLASYSVHAEDIDLFLNNTAVSTTGLPNVLILLDNTGNWNSAFVNEQKALASTFKNLPVDKFNVGIMTFGDPEVGAVRAAIRPMNETNRELYKKLVESLEVDTDRANARTLARNFSEAFRYFKGLESTSPSKVVSGLNSDRDYAGNTNGTPESILVHQLSGSALSDERDITYSSPLDPDSCADTFIIYIGNTVPSGNVTKDNISRNSAAGNELGALPNADTSQIQLAYDSHQGNYADEWARYLYDRHGIRTYTVDVDPTPRPGGQLNGMGNSDLLESMAAVGGGKYYRVDSSVEDGEEIELVLSDIFSEIQSKDAVFASVALPASTTTQSTFLNQVFIGMFRPDANRKPRWYGNLKQYRLGYTGTGSNKSLKLLDARGEGKEAINSNTGFITECARSYWTPEGADAYWAPPLLAKGGCIIGDETSNSPDGPVVEKGGQAYTRRSSMSRTVYTCTACQPGGTGDQDALTTYGTLSAVSDDALTNWAVGHDILNEDGRDITGVRASVHGDVIHSRPVALNYGTQNDPQVVVFYGGNDGLLRAVNGNRSTPIGDFAAGSEFWTFKPKEFSDSDITRLMDNDPKVRVPATGTNPGIDGALKEYGMDGAIVSFDGKIGGEAKKFIYATMRRGGRAVYAFDVTTVTSPKLLWRVGCEESLASDSNNCSDPGWANIGQTWSRPTVAFRAGYDDGEPTPSLLPLLLMGGGYDTCDDFDAGLGGANNNCGDNSKGNSIYVMDGQTGEILKTFDTKRQVPGAVTVVPVSKYDPTIKYAYAADTGGNVYRISGPVDNDTGVASQIGGTPPADWEITPIASLGCNTVTTCAASRKFLFEPDVVEPVGAGGALYVVLGSGDREKPLLSYGAATSVSNYAFTLIDNPGNGAWLTDDNNACGGVPIICLDALTTVTTDNGANNAGLDRRGWKLALGPKEQVVSSALTVADIINFSTHIPAEPLSGSCESNLGIATTYNLSYKDGEGDKVNIEGGGLVPSPVAGMVILDDGVTIVPFCIGCGGENSAIGSKEPEGGAEWDQPKGRVYWNIKK